VSCILYAKDPFKPGQVLELGSGLGSFSAYIPDLTPSERFFVEDIRIILDGQRLPFEALVIRDRNAD
jgi:hypothetical protein